MTDQQDAVERLRKIYHRPLPANLDTQANWEAVGTLHNALGNALDALESQRSRLETCQQENERLREGLIAYEMAIQCAEHGYLPSTSAAAEVRSFVNGYEGSPEIDVEVRGWITEQEAQDE